MAAKATSFEPTFDVVDEARAKASENVETHRESVLRVIDQAIADLAREGAQASHGSLARLFDGIGGLAGMFQLDTLGQAAKRLGGIMRALDERGTLDRNLIGLHIAALRVMRAHADTEGAPQILRGLDQIAAGEARRSSLGSV